ncbi:MAG TPA: hypothetical protein VND54_12265 [Candidatus Saccharimonadales bacterium]|nr:hypothetical protein [Candidatus Saccharimonadales bacterium]
MNLSDQRGIVRGCCLGLIVLVILVGGSVVVAVRALAAPALGAPPAGPSHGAGEEAIAVALGQEMAGQLVQGPHGVVVLSEQDLTVLAVADNPHPGELRDLQVRVRDGLVVVSARISAGPFTPTVVAHISLSLRPGAAGPVIAAQVPEVDIGMLGLPGFAGSGLVSQIDAALSLDRLFAIAPKLSALRTDIECVAVVPGGVAVGVHDPGVPSVASSCG